MLLSGLKIPLVWIGNRFERALMDSRARVTSYNKQYNNKNGALVWR